MMWKKNRPAGVFVSIRSDQSVVQIENLIGRCYGR
jgi:hypothetical protein